MDKFKTPRDQNAGDIDVSSVCTEDLESVVDSSDRETRHDYGDRWAVQLPKKNADIRGSRNVKPDRFLLPMTNPLTRKHTGKSSFLQERLLHEMRRTNLMLSKLVAKERPTQGTGVDDLNFDRNTGVGRNSDANVFGTDLKIDIPTLDDGSSSDDTIVRQETCQHKNSLNDGRTRCNCKKKQKRRSCFSSSSDTTGYSTAESLNCNRCSFNDNIGDIKPTSGSSDIQICAECMESKYRHLVKTACRHQHTRQMCTTKHSFCKLNKTKINSTIQHKEDTLNKKFESPKDTQSVMATRSSKPRPLSYAPGYYSAVYGQTKVRRPLNTTTRGRHTRHGDIVPSSSKQGATLTYRRYSVAPTQEKTTSIRPWKPP